MHYQAPEGQSRNASAQLLDELEQEIEHVDNLAAHLQEAANRLIDPAPATAEESKSVNNEPHTLMSSLSARVERLREIRERLESINAQIERAV